MEFPTKFPVLRVNQPMGTFYCASIPARYLLEVCFSDTMKAIIDNNGLYNLDGTQRIVREDRLKQITQYINRADTAFPNSIILAANYNENGNTIDDINDPSRWQITVEENGQIFLTIPSAKKLAAIIDGQHRLFAFANADQKRLDMQLLCSIYIDLPKAYQAQLFAIINSTQRPVDKSLTYELYGYNINEEDPAIWSPDKLSVYLTRKLNLDRESPFFNHIKIAPISNFDTNVFSKDWNVSTAVVVEGILKLISTNPRSDSNLIYKSRKSNRSDLGTDRSPLRKLYLEQNDAVLYKLIINYFSACKNIFWDKANQNSFIVKTVGIQALFDILKEISPDALYVDKKISLIYFEKYLEISSDIDFSSDEFRNASGSGRRTIREAIASAIGLRKKPD